MTNEVREKSFDCLKWTWEVRDRHYEEIKHMSYEEWRSWLDKRLSNNPLLADVKTVAPTSRRWRDHGLHRAEDRAETQVVVAITRDETSEANTACAVEGAIRAQGASVEEIRANAKAAATRYLDATDPPAPSEIHLSAIPARRSHSSVGFPGNCGFVLRTASMENRVTSAQTTSWVTMTWRFLPQRF